MLMLLVLIVVDGVSVMLVVLVMMTMMMPAGCADFGLGARINFIRGDSDGSGCDDSSLGGRGSDDSSRGGGACHPLQRK